MKRTTLQVEEIGADRFGETVAVADMLLDQNLKCWLVPKNAEREVASIKRGIRIFLPGLGKEAFE